MAAMQQVTPTSIPFNCPHCGNATDVDPEYAGQSGPCSACGKEITVPTAFQARKAQNKEKSKKSGVSVLVLPLILVSAGFLTLILLGVVIATVVMPAAKNAQANVLKSDCHSNMQRIAMALQAYHQDHGRFPPAVVYDDKGVALHSWRVLILPYLDQESQMVYRAYDMTSAWNSPTNLRWANAAPSVFTCPCDSRAKGGETSYLAVVGVGTVFEKDKVVKRKDIEDADGLASTLLVVESHGCAIGWSEPKDMDVSMLANGINSNVNGAVRGGHGSEAHIIDANGEVQSLDVTMSVDELTLMATYDDDQLSETVETAP